MHELLNELKMLHLIWQQWVSLMIFVFLFYFSILQLSLFLLKTWVTFILYRRGSDEAFTNVQGSSLKVQATTVVPLKRYATLMYFLQNYGPGRIYSPKFVLQCVLSMKAEKCFWLLFMPLCFWKNIILFSENVALKICLDNDSRKQYLKQWKLTKEHFCLVS